EAYLVAGDTDNALSSGARALEAARNSGEEASEAWAALWLLGAVATRLHLPEAETHYRESLAASHEESRFNAPVFAAVASGVLGWRCIDGDAVGESDAFDDPGADFAVEPTPGLGGGHHEPKDHEASRLLR